MMANQSAPNRLLRPDGCEVKNDRMLRPAEQPNPDAYVHIKERLKDGIAVSGCKVHI